MKKSLGLFVGVIGLLMPGTMLATNYTFNMNSAIVSGGLDHHNAYAWNISGFSLGTQVVTGATLTFTNFANWDDNANQLFVWIGATSSGGTAVTGGNYAGSSAGFTQTTNYFQDSADGATIADYFNNTSATALYDANVAKMRPANLPTTTSGHTFVASPSGFDTNPDPTMTVNFSGVLGDLTTYIGSAGTGDFALLLDSDCHYFFSSATLTLTTGAAPVPEPGSILLLMTVLAGVCFGLRRKSAATLA